jgi:septum site-determining protein MinD
VKKLKTISFWSAGGGTGKTTLSAAFATALKGNKNEVALADFKEVTPHIHKLFEMELTDKSVIYEKIENGVEAAESVKKSLKKRRGIWVFTGIGLDDFLKFQASHFEYILKVLNEEFEYVVVDTGAGIFFSSTYAALKNSGLIFAVLAPNRWCLEDTAVMMDFVCSRWNIEKSKFKAILNIADSGEIDIHTVERVLDLEAFGIRRGRKNLALDVNRMAKKLFGRGELKECMIKTAKEVGSIGFN